jgi:hypothetical protein
MLQQDTEEDEGDYIRKIIQIGPRTWCENPAEKKT